MDFFQLLFVYDVQFQLKGIGITTGVGDILFDREKTFLTDVMLHLTGILRGCFRSDAETDQPVAEKNMTLISRSEERRVGKEC